MTASDIGAQYATGLSRQSIEQALAAAGKDIDAPGARRPRRARGLPHAWAGSPPGSSPSWRGSPAADRVLDAGAGIGGTARFLAATYGCQVTAVDLTEEYCETAGWLNQLTGLDEAITVRQADVTDLPFADAAFDVVTSQHVQMNVADKARLYAEARRVLADGGRLAIWDITAGEPGPLDYPLPWADQPGRSHLVPAARAARRRRGAPGSPSVTGPTSPTDAATLMRAVLSPAARPARAARVRPRFRRQGREPHPGAGIRPPARHPGGRARGRHRPALTGRKPNPFGISC